MQQRLDALVRAQHVPRPLMDLLTLVVAHCNDTDAFKRHTASRLGHVEQMICLPSTEISETRSATVAALEEMQRNVEVLEAQFRATFEDLKAEAEIRLRELSTLGINSVREVETLREAAREEYEAQHQQHREDLSRVVDVELARLKDGAVKVTRAALDGLQRDAEGLLVDAFHGVCEHRDAAVSELKKELVVQRDAATTMLRSLVSDAEISVRRTAEGAARFVGLVLETVNALPLLECHRAANAVALVEARMDVLWSRLSGGNGGQQPDVRRVETRLDRVELTVQQCVDRMDTLLLVSQSAPSGGGAVTPPQQQEARSPHVSGGEVLLSSSNTPPLRELLREHSARRPTEAAPQNHQPLLLRLQSRLDALEGAMLTVKHTADDAMGGMKALGRLVEEQVIGGIERATDRVDAMHRLWGLSAVEVDHLVAPRGFDDSPSVAAASTSRGLMQERLRCAHYLLQHVSVLKLLKPLPQLGMELADGGPPFGGVVVLGIIPGGAAEDAGLHVEDVLLRVQEEAVASRSELFFALATLPARRPIGVSVAVAEVTVYRPSAAVLFSVSLPV